MISVEFKENPRIDQIVDRIKDSVSASWDANSGEIESQITSIISGILSSKMSGWSPSVELLEKYPFFGNITRFISDYVSCFVVNTSDMEIKVSLDTDKLQSKGFPESMGDLLEFGGLDFPQFSHFRETIIQWNNSFASKFLDNVSVKAAYSLV